MILLGIDTCGALGTLALARVSPGAGELEGLGSAELPGRSAAAGLVPSLGRMLRDAGIPWDQVAGLVVVDGPGSFTGIRIGISTAKALAEAGAVPLYAISRLRVLAEANRAKCAALDAGRGEFFLGCWDLTGEQAGLCLEADLPPVSEWLCTHGELASRLAKGAPEILACELQVAERFPQLRLVAPPTAMDALRVALPEILAGRQTDVAALDGRYLRRSDLYRTTHSATQPA